MNNSITKVSYTINGITTHSYAEALRLGWNDYCDKPNYTEVETFPYPIEVAETNRAKHREAVERKLAEMAN